ncbi:MAG TPA: head-tail connector protein [Tepidisphaeraceae bacterium]|nr:head-tail connector protein [Tepidisphaeraceae bacterium]
MAAIGSITVVEEPENEPVTVPEMRDHCRIDVNDDNEYLAALIVAARRYFENRTGLLLAQQTIRQRHHCFPCGMIRLQRMPVSSVEVKYIDADGAEQTLDDDAIQTNFEDTIPAIAPSPGTSWPATESGRLGAVWIDIEGGYETCPADLKQGVKMLAAHWYAQREPVSEKSMSNVPLTVEAIIGMNSTALIP